MQDPENFNSKMVLKRRNKVILSDKKPVLNCAHRMYKMFFICPTYDITPHLHCIRCGSILQINISLRKKLNEPGCIVYNSHISCDRLTDHLHLYSTRQSLEKEVQNY